MNEAATQDNTSAAGTVKIVYGNLGTVYYYIFIFWVAEKTDRVVLYGSATGQNMADYHLRKTARED